MPASDINSNYHTYRPVRHLRKAERAMVMELGSAFALLFCDRCLLRGLDRLVAECFVSFVFVFQGIFEAKSFEVSNAL